MDITINTSKSLVAWFADMLGFKHVAEYLREIDFKQALKDAFVALFTKVKDFIGAIFDFEKVIILECLQYKNTLILSLEIQSIKQ